MARLLAIPLLLAASPVRAAVFSATSPTDLPDVDPGDGSCDANASPSVTLCTLRAAIMEANALAGTDDIHLLAGATYPLTLTGVGEGAGDLNVTSDVRIHGYFSTVTAAPGWSYRILSVTDGSLEISDLVIENGDTSASGGCLSSTRDLTLRRVEIRSCTAGATGGAVQFGALYSTLLLDRCWLHGNQATNGGGIYSIGTVVLLDSAVSVNAATFADGGGIRAGGRLYVNNSTIAGNFAKRHGGGIASQNPIEISSSSIVANFCDTDGDGDGDGCGIWALGAQVAVRNSIVAENVNWDHFDADDCVADVDSQGYNLIGHPSVACTGFSAATHDLLGAPTLDPRVQGFGDHGGPTPSMPPEPDSPVIDAANPAGCVGDVDGDQETAPTPLVTDQRGFRRALDGDGAGGGRCDIGATEYAIFADGFESGDVAAWSTAVP